MTATLQVVARGESGIAMTRSFDAPCAAVFDALTRPELVTRWLGPRSWTLPVCEIDLRVGGRYRYVWRPVSGGADMEVGGVFRDVVRPARIVHTELFDPPWYPGEGVVTTEFAEAGGLTMLRATLRYETPAARDGVLASPMRHGVAESYDRLDELLAGR